MLVQGCQRNVKARTMASDCVTIVSCGQKFPASRDALRQCSHYFESMFKWGMKESRCDEIEVQDIEPDTLRSLIDESAGRPVTVTDDNVDDLLVAAYIFQFERLLGDCVNHLIEATHLDNAVETWKTGDTFNLRPLRRVALVTLLWEFEEFVKHASFETCPFALLRTLLSNETLNVPDEAVVAIAAEKWLKANLSTCTEEEMVAVGSCVRHRLLSHWVFSAWRSFWKDSFGGLFDRWDDVLQNRVATPRSRVVQPAVVAYGLTQESADAKSLAVYTSAKGDGPFTLHSVLPAANRPDCLRGFVVCSVGKDAYFLCGEYGIGSGRWNREVFRWNHALEKWDPVSTLPEPRRHCKSVVVGNCIHLYGGYGRYRVRLYSIEIYDTVTGSWHREDVHPDAAAANASAVVNVNGRACIVPASLASDNAASRATHAAVSDPTLAVPPTVAVPLAFYNTIVVCKGAKNWYLFHEPRIFTEYLDPIFALRSLVCGYAMGDALGFFVEDSKTAVVYNFEMNKGRQVEIGLDDHLSIECCFGLPCFDLGN